MLSVVVLISGSGSNLRALLEACDNPLFPARIIAVGSDNPARGLEHAELFGVPTFVVNPAAFSSRLAWAETLLENVNFFRPDLVVLAGFMKWLPANFVDALGPKIINIHPSLLPLFPGAHAVHDTLLQSYVLESHKPHDMDDLAQRHLSIKTITYVISAGP